MNFSQWWYYLRLPVEYENHYTVVAFKNCPEDALHMNNLSFALSFFLEAFHLHYFGHFAIYSHSHTQENKEIEKTRSLNTIATIKRYFEMFKAIDTWSILIQLTQIQG